MTTDPLDQQIERLEELDKARTPGDWIAGVHPGNQRLNIIKPICFGKYVGKLPECEGGAVYFLDRGTAEFIAAAPEMMQVIRALQEKLHRYSQGYIKELREAEQVAGKALGYPYYKDDLKNFPDCNEEDGVCTGEHTPVTIVMELAEKYKALQSREKAMREALEWQPIETAPKDGSEVLGVYKPESYSADYSIIRWNERRKTWVAMADGSDSIQSQGDTWTYYHEPYITHWMPLPKPPALAGKDA